jgi:hypothetical protein
MTSRIPEPGSRMEDEGLPDMGYTLGQKEVTGDAQEGFALPGDIQTDTEDVDEVGTVGVIGPDEFGTTAREMHDGEPLTDRLSREEPDVLNDDAVRTSGDEASDASNPFPGGAQFEGPGSDMAGRLVEPDEGARSDTETDAVARDAGDDLSGFTAEEAAMHVEPEA